MWSMSFIAVPTSLFVFSREQEQLNRVIKYGAEDLFREEPDDEAEGGDTAAAAPAGGGDNEKVQATCIQYTALDVLRQRYRPFVNRVKRIAKRGTGRFHCHLCISHRSDNE